MTDQQQTADSAISRLEWKLADLQKGALLSTIRDKLEDLDAQLTQLPATLEQLRTRGYFYRNYLEQRVQTAAKQWPTTRVEVRREVDRAVRDLADDLARAESTVHRLQAFKTRPLSSVQAVVSSAEDLLTRLERKIDAAENTVEGLYDTIAKTIQETQKEAQECQALMEQIESASFSLQAGEAPIACIKAKTVTADKDDSHEGVLFLTDCRLIFERQEKVSKKKVLFITTQSEFVREPLWQAAVGLLESAQASEQRRALVLKDELLTLRFQPSAEVRESRLELKGDSEKWRALINRVQTGDIANERVGAQTAQGTQAAPAAQAITYRIPAKCPSCGAGLPGGLLKGQSSVTCEYCGVAIPLERESAEK